MFEQLPQLSQLSSLFSASSGFSAPAALPLPVILGSLSLALCLGQALAFVYDWSYQGLSYSRSFTLSLPLAALSSALVMLAISGSLVLGLGALGTMSFVRFRTNIRDLWDMSFLFAALALGFSCGAQSPRAAIVGAILFCGAALLLRWSGAGRRQRFDGVLRFALPRPAPGISSAGAAETTLRPLCRRLQLLSVREHSQGEQLELSYQLQLRPRQTQGSLIDALSAAGAREITFFAQDQHSEL